MSNKTKMVATLVVVCVVAAAVLALVYNFTKQRIDERLDSELAASLAVVLPEAKSFAVLEQEDLSIDLSSLAEEVYVGRDQSGKDIGLAYVKSAPGFKGDIRVLIGMSLPDGAITGVHILSHSETPDVGDKIEEDWFLEQYVGWNPGSEQEPEFDTITRATVSSVAVNTVVKESARQIFQELVPALGEGAG